MFRHPANRLLTVAGFTATAAAVPAAAAIAHFPAHSDAVGQPCPNAQTTTPYVLECLPGVSPAPADIVPNGPDSLPQMNGIYCTGANTGTCIGLSRIQEVNPARPDTSVRHSP